MAMLKLRDGRESDVKEPAETLKTPSTGASVPAMIEVTEVRRTVKRKFPTPVDTKAEFLEQEIKHLVAVASIMDVQPTAAEAEKAGNLLPVHDRRQADMPAVSGPFKHDFDQHPFAYETVDGRRVQKSVLVLDEECQKDPAAALPADRPHDIG